MPSKSQGAESIAEANQHAHGALSKTSRTFSPQEAPAPVWPEYSSIANTQSSRWIWETEQEWAHIELTPHSYG